MKDIRTLEPWKKVHHVIETASGLCSIHASRYTGQRSGMQNGSSPLHVCANQNLNKTAMVVKITVERRILHVEELRVR